MPVTMESFVAAEPRTEDALADLDAQVRRGTSATFAFVFFSDSYDHDAILAFMRSRFPGVPFTGGTSSYGVMSDHGLAGDQSLGLLLVSDPEGQYGVAASELGDDPAASAEHALLAALEKADAPGELPELVWVLQVPGREESVLAGLRRVVGDRCPIVGGSSADDTLQGRWRQISPDGATSDGLVVAALFPSGGVSCSYQGGYEPTGESGIVTAIAPDSPRASPDEAGLSRHILTIDDEPAAAVYTRWAEGEVPPDVAEGGGSLIYSGITHPLAIKRTVGAVSHFRQIHPRAVDEQGGITTFAAVREGDRIYGMRGSTEGLIRRAGRVVNSAMAATGRPPEDVAGALIAYCAGCRAMVDNDVKRVADAVCHELGERPFLGCFTSGEQGPLFGHNVHANLMISAVIFGR